MQATITAIINLRTILREKKIQFPKMTMKLVLNVLVLLSARCSAHYSEGRVYLGQPDGASEFPFAVLLQMAEKPFFRLCTGSIIAHHWVLTAAHCIKTIPMIIKYGDYTKPPSKSKSYAKIIKTFIHPNFQFNQGSVTVNDIALLNTEKVPLYLHAKLLALDYNTLYGLPAKYAGFGYLSRDFQNVYENLMDQGMPLQVGEGIIMPCSRVERSFKYGPAVCVSPKCSNKFQQARPGDSGGPLVYKGKIVGVAMSMSNSAPITFYYPVSNSMQWIKNIIDFN